MFFRGQVRYRQRMVIGAGHFWLLKTWSRAVPGERERKELWE